MRSKKLLGFCLIVLAIVIGVMSVTVRNFNPFFPGWWAIFIVFLGISKLEQRGERLMGLLITLGGGYIIFSANTNFHVNFYNVAIVFGLLIVGVSLLKPKTYHDQYHYESNKEYTKYSNTYSEETKADFENASSSTKNTENNQSFSVVLGSRVYDLTGLNPNVDNYISCECVLGELRLTLPRNMNVVIRDSNFLGEIRDYRTNAVNAYDHTLYLNCNCVLGQIAFN